MSQHRRCTIGELVDSVASQFPDTEALVYPFRDVRLTYSQFRDTCSQVAKGLMKLGVERGGHVAIWATNQPEWVLTQYSTGKMGAVLVTVNTSYRSFELEYLMKQSDSSTLILEAGFKSVSYTDMLYELCPELRECQPGRLKSARFPHLRNVIFLGEERLPGMFTWADVVAMGSEVSDDLLNERQRSLDPDDVINMQYTSGTTGFPKGVMLTHLNVVADGTLIGDNMRLSEKDRMCIPVPLFHCFGCVLGTMACVTHATTMVPVEVFSPLRVLETVQAERCTALHGVPTMFIAELEHPEFARFDLSHLRTGIMAGSPCPIEVMKSVVDRMGMSEVTIAYGQTESSPVVTMTRTDDPLELRVTTVGRSLPEVEVKIIDPETGADSPSGEQGEIVVRGFVVMKGYYKMPEATAQAVDENGWLHTGDLGTRDEAGYFKITGRIKDMVIRGGENIYPREIEEFLYTHPKVSDVQVVGVPSRKYGEEVCAFVRLKDGEESSSEEILEYFNGRLARYKTPRYVSFVDEFPVTASGKIQKYKLRERAVIEFGLEADDSIETA